MKKVELYTQPDCPPCQIVKQFFQHHHVSYTEYNIRQDGAALKRLMYDYSAHSTPTVVVDGEPVIGFNIARLQELLGLEE